MNAQITSNDLQKKIWGYLETLALETDEARKSEEMQRYLDFVARFHQYSPSNIFLIMLSKPDATMVAGFQAWKKMGRYVMKGEKGIPIFAPMIYKEDPNDENSKVLHGFRVVYVFDISQTDGDPLPPVPDWKSPEKSVELTEKLIRFAESKGITVIYKELPGETQGVSRRGAIEISPDAGTKTLIHELAHELLHQRTDIFLDREIREMEAECVGYVVAKYFGIDGLNSPNYITLNGIASEMIQKNKDRMHHIASEIIQRIEDMSESQDYATNFT